ncbi:flagellar protein FlaG [Persephonella sp. KM09-Lau-8]|uniref:flagellar protein FlaG n=1 Tax=Persephonella sp. KM09-Lau-8 TaxID=1158345 RepID=UPI000496A43D|nr:flagellar protein FlaG [Persephonella sp. KM09-Lau-8]
MDIKNVNNVMDKSLVEGQTLDRTRTKEINNSPAEQIAKQQQEELKNSLQKLDKKQLEDLFKDIKEKFDYMNKYLKIEIDKDLHEPVIKIMDKQTNKVIRQIPPEYVLELAKRIDELVGLLIKKEV